MDDEGETEAYKKLRAAFVAKVFRFHEQRGTPLKRLPMLGGRELNIYHLYEEVQKRGGSEKVTKVRMWGEIARTFNLPSTVTSASYAIRNHFIKLLEQFEAAENGIVLSYNSSQPSPSPSLSSLPILPSLPKPIQFFKKPMTTVTAPPPQQTSRSETDVGLSKLMRSLLSGLPNEVDFAFNVLLILSNSNALSIHKIPSLLDVILAHVAVFNAEDSGLESMYREAWYPNRELDFLAFWETSVPEWVYSVILDAPIKKSVHECLLFNRASLMLHGKATPPATPTAGEEGREEGVEGREEGVEGLRVAQVSTILNNLSTNDTSAAVLTENSGVLRFLVLAMSCDLPSVRIPGLDCLANLASHLKLEYEFEEDECPALVMMETLHQCVLSEDRFAVKRGIEILGKLAWTLSNSHYLSSTPIQVYHRMLTILLLPDCELTMIVLDSLYTLSQFGRELARRIATVRGIVDTLVCLLSFRVEDLPAGSLNHIKLYFVGDSTSLAQYLADIQGKTSSTPLTSSTATPTVVGSGLNVTGGTVVGKGGVTSPLATNQIRSRPVIAARASSPLTANQTVSRVSQVVGSSQLSQSLANGKISISSSSGLYSILSGQSQSGSQNSPSEVFATEWLKKTYEVQSSHHLVLLVDMYAQYVLHCSAKGKRDFLNNIDFINILKRVFPASQLREVKTVAKKVIHFLTGLKKVTQPRTTHPPLTNHTPSAVTVSTATPHTISTTSAAKTTAVVTNPPVVSFGHKSSSVSLQSSSVSSIGSRSVSVPPSSLSPSLSPSRSPTPITSSTLSSRESTPALGISPEGDNIDNDVIARQPNNKTNSVERKDDQRQSVTSNANISANNAIPLTGVLLSNDRTTSSKDDSTGGKVGMNCVDRDHIRMRHTPSSSPSPSPLSTSLSFGDDVTDDDVTVKKVAPNLSKVSPTDAHFSAASTPSPTSHLVTRHTSTPSPVTPSQNIITSDSREQPKATMATGGINFSQGTKYSSNDKSPRTLTDFQFDNHEDMDCHEITKSVDQKSISVEPVLLVSAVDQNRSHSPNSSSVSECVPEAKRIRLTPPVQNSKQQQATQQQATQQQTSQQQTTQQQTTQQQTTQQQTSQQTAQVSLKPVLQQRQTISKQPLTRQTSYTTSSIRFINSKSPVVSSGESSPNQSNRSQTGSGNSVRPVCLWENCMSMRYSWKDLFHHTVTCHISPLPTHTPSPCHWAGCTTSPVRMKPSLIRHVETHHCSPGPKPVPPSVTATLARLKHCPPLETEVESPLTKAVRVTAALVLRNLCREAPSTHEALRRHERRLSDIALSSREASNILADCLYYLNSPPPPPLHTNTSSSSSSHSH